MGMAMGGSNYRGGGVNPTQIIPLLKSSTLTTFLLVGFFGLVFHLQNEGQALS